MKIKRNDHVVVITGKQKGAKGKVTHIFPEKKTLIVEGVNMCIKHQKAKEGVAGGRIEVEAPLHISNVKVLCPKTKKSTRIGFVREQDGKKARIAKVSQTVLENVFVKS